MTTENFKTVGGKGVGGKGVGGKGVGGKGVGGKGVGGWVGGVGSEYQSSIFSLHIYAYLYLENMLGSFNMIVCLKRILSNEKALSHKGGGTAGKLSPNRSLVPDQA